MLLLLLLVGGYWSSTWLVVVVVVVVMTTMLLCRLCPVREVECGRERGKLWTWLGQVYLRCFGLMGGT